MDSEVENRRKQFYQKVSNASCKTAMYHAVCVNGLSYGRVNFCVCFLVVSMSVSTFKRTRVERFHSAKIVDVYNTSANPEFATPLATCSGKNLVV